MVILTSQQREVPCTANSLVNQNRTMVLLQQDAILSGVLRQGLQVKAHVAAPKPLQMLLNGTNLEKKILPERWAVNVAGQARLLTPYG